MSHDCLTDLYIRMIVSPKTFPQKILCDLPLGNSSRILMDSAEKPAMVRCQGGLSLQRRGLGVSHIISYEFPRNAVSPTPRIRRSAHPIGGFPSAQCITNRVPAAWRARMIVKSGYSGKM